MLRRTAGLAVAAFLAGLVTAHAQAPAEAVPEKMPFDVPYGMPLDLATAQKAIAASMAEAHKHGWKMAIAVVGPSGDLVAEATMDGTQYASIAIAQNKARTAALFRRPSKVFADGVNKGSPSVLSLLIPAQAVASDGGYPIVVDGKLVGAIGCSGGVAPQDGATARAGMAAATGR